MFYVLLEKTVEPAEHTALLASDAEKLRRRRRDEMDVCCLGIISCLRTFSVLAPSSYSSPLLSLSPSSSALPPWNAGLGFCEHVRDYRSVTCSCSLLAPLGSKNKSSSVNLETTSNGTRLSHSFTYRNSDKLNPLMCLCECVDMGVDGWMHLKGEIYTYIYIVQIVNISMTGVFWVRGERRCDERMIVVVEGSTCAVGRRRTVAVESNCWL